MKGITELYEEGASYVEYVGTADEEARLKHLHYLEKMKLSGDETGRLSEIKRETRLLVFCDTFCNDCRITLALLENMKDSCPLLQYRIASRKGNEELMRQLGGGIGIPLIAKVQANAAEAVFKEYPEVLHDKIESAGEEDRSNIIVNFRRGLYKEEMFRQLISKLK